VWEVIRSNNRKSMFLGLVMAGLLFAVGYMGGEFLLGPGGGGAGLVAAFAIWMILTILAFFQGKQILLALSEAQKIRKEDHPRLFNIVEEMKIASQLPAMPDIYMMDDPAPNAFATGRKPENSAVAVTAGLLNRLNRDELQGVIAHEMGHIKNRDILFMTMLGVMMGAIVMLADIATRWMFMGGRRRSSRTSPRDGVQGQAIILIIGLILIILAPIVAQIIYFAASRRREYLADASAAQFTRYPEGLASALEKIASAPFSAKNVNRVTAPMYIVNPLQQMKAFSSLLFSTHPPVEERIRILRSMAGGSGYISYDRAFRKTTGESSSVLPASALSQPDTPLATTIPIAAAMGEGDAIGGEIDSHAGKFRETTNALWKAQNYTFINCECGAKLKVPPSLQRPEVKCLRCGRAHQMAPAQRKAKR
jgi:heat shock protein HtpX